MNIDQLIEQLEDARDDMGGETEVRVAYQPSWPLRGTLAAVTVPNPEDRQPHCDDHICFLLSCTDCKAAMAEAVAAGYDPEDPDPEDGDPERRMLWLAVGSAPYDENPYAPKWAWGE